ncbi:MAG TPA: guanylate kinase [Sedimentisphaerales bacterium]|nr:guanylate kinase [Sedimentisphaerales bacterium]
MSDRGRLVVISGPSGVGKSTICRELVKRTGALLSVSMTTRPRTPSEVDGVDYHFVTRQQFRKMLKDGAFLEHAEVFGNMYGTPAEPAISAVNAGKSVILEIDVQGGLQIKKAFPDALLVFILPPDAGELAQRINRRARDSADETQKRLVSSTDEMAVAWKNYSHMVVNDDLEHAINMITKMFE